MRPLHTVRCVIKDDVGSMLALLALLKITFLDERAVLAWTSCSKRVINF